MNREQLSYETLAADCDEAAHRCSCCHRWGHFVDQCPQWNQDMERQRKAEHGRCADCKSFQTWIKTVIATVAFIAGALFAEFFGRFGR